MTGTSSWKNWFRSPSNLIAGTLVVMGFILSNIDWSFFALTAIGTFGPGILRELGWLNDKDEFEMRAARRAGYHAYLIGGLMVFLLVAGLGSREPEISGSAELASAILVVMWFTWLLSSLLAYWGPRKTADRILIAFGCVWLLFNILSGEGNWLASFMQSLLAAPFFGLVFVAHRRPRVAGVILLLVAAFFFWFFDLVEIFNHPLEKGRVEVLVLFLGPLITSGIALLSLGRAVGVEPG